MEEKTKKCIKCGEEKNLSEFYTRDDHKKTYIKKTNRPYVWKMDGKGKGYSGYGTDGYRWDCKSCYKKRIHAYYKALPPEEQRRRDLKRKYGITPQEFDDKLKSQGGGCAICGGEVNGKGGQDHCHKTKKVRGILCSHCNASIGHMDDDIERLKKAIIYLEKWR